jgi:hypothetical protein
MIPWRKRILNKIWSDYEQHGKKSASCYNRQDKCKSRIRQNGLSGVLAFVLLVFTLVKFEATFFHLSIQILSLLEIKRLLIA